MTAQTPQPAIPPYARGSDTSLAAAVSVATDTSRLRRLVLQHIAAQGDEGATCCECEIALRLSHQTCSARVNELKRDGRILDSGKRRPTVSGRKATVWVAAA